MADYYLGHESGQVSSMTLVFSSVAAIAIGGPLLGMMVFSFLASSMLLLVFSPFLLFFSPLLLGVAFLFVGTLVAFVVAIVMALTAHWSLNAWMDYKGNQSEVGWFEQFGGPRPQTEGKERDYRIDNLPTTTTYKG